MYELLRIIIYYAIGMFRVWLDIKVPLVLLVKGSLDIEIRLICH